MQLHIKNKFNSNYLLTIITKDTLKVVVQFALLAGVDQDLGASVFRLVGGDGFFEFIADLLSKKNISYIYVLCFKCWLDALVHWCCILLSIFLIMSLKFGNPNAQMYNLT